MASIHEHFLRGNDSFETVFEHAPKSMRLLQSIGIREFFKVLLFL